MLVWIAVLCGQFSGGTCMDAYLCLGTIAGHSGMLHILIANARTMVLFPF